MNQEAIHCIMQRMSGWLSNRQMVFLRNVENNIFGSWYHDYQYRSAYRYRNDSYVDGIKVLTVGELKHGSSARGNVGLYVDIGTDGFFRNLCISYDD